MASVSVSSDRQSARIAVVEQHIRFENAHDIDGVISTFGEIAHYDDEPWGEHFEGSDGVRRYYEQLIDLCLVRGFLRARARRAQDDHSGNGEHQQARKTPLAQTFAAL